MECQVAHQILATGLGLLVGLGGIGIAITLALRGISRAIRDQQ